MIYAGQHALITDHFVREGFGQRKIGEIKYFDVMYFYYYLLNEKDLQANTVDTIHTVLHPTFQLAVRDGIIRLMCYGRDKKERGKE